MSASPLISTAPLTAALIKNVTILCHILNQRAYGTSIQIKQQRKYYSHLHIFIFWFIESKV